MGRRGPEDEYELESYVGGETIGMYFDDDDEDDDDYEDDDD